MMIEADHKTPGYVSGFAIGAALGAAAMFFLGTKKGRKLAKMMRSGGGKTVKELEHLVKEVETKSGEFAAKAATVQKTLEAKAGSTSKEVTTLAKTQINHIKKLQEKGRAAAERYFQDKDSKKP